MPRILVADDSKVVQKLAQHLLSSWGYEVTVVANGEEAITWLTNERPDLIISDVNMPGRTGYDICKYVRTQPALCDTPLLLISGVVNDEVIHHAKACRANGLLKKPFDETKFKSQILDLLARPASRSGSQKIATSPRESQASPVNPPGARAGLSGSSNPRPHTAESLSPNSDGSPGEPPDSALKAAEPKGSRIPEGALQAVQQTVAGMKKLEAALAEERAQCALLTQQLATAHKQGERVAELESLLALEQAKSAQLTKRLENAERAAAEASARADAITQTMAEITRLVGPSS